MTETIDTAQPEALRLADAIDPFTRKFLDNLTCSAAAAELRRLQNALEMAVSDAQRSWRELAAAEARNATLTDDAARYRFLRDMTAAPSWYASHANMGISCEVFDMRLDAEIARAAASIGTKGDGHG